MKQQLFIEQQIELGYRLHLHDGVWWQQQRRFFFKPAIRHQRIEPEQATPAPFRSLVGYSHLIPDGSAGNSSYSVMRQEWAGEKSFGIDCLSKSRRSQVRRGEKKNQVRQLTDLEPLIDDVQRIVISTRMRTGVGLPASYYSQYYDQWRKDMLKLFDMEDRPWWGAFCEGRLIAYYQTTVLEDTLFINAAKSHSDFLSNCPNDVLLYAVLCDAFNEKRCRFVEFGDWSSTDSNLTYFKESYGFSKYEFPVYRHLSPLARPAYKLWQFWHGRKQARVG